MEHPVVYFALENITYGSYTYEPGDIIVNVAYDYARIALVRDGKIAPVLTSTLPRDLREFVKNYEYEDPYTPLVELSADDIADGGNEEDFDLDVFDDDELLEV